MPVAIEVFSFHSILEMAQGLLLSNPGVAIINCRSTYDEERRSERDHTKKCKRQHFQMKAHVRAP
jgi:hypothetical protein